MKLTEKIELTETYKSMTNSEKQILKYLSDNINDIENLTVEKIAKNSFCSTTSVNRFCKKLNVSGFSELKETIRYEQKKNKPRSNQYYVDDLGKIVEELKFDEMANVLDLLTVDKHICVFGTGASFVGAQYLARLLLRIGFKAYATNEKPFVISNPPDLIFVISKTGETYTALTTVSNLPESCETIAITKADSRLHKSCDYALTHNQELEVDDSVLTENQLPIFLIISELINQLCKKYNCS